MAGHDLATVAAIARTAHADRKPMREAVAEQLGVTINTAAMLIQVARAQGHDVPVRNNSRQPAPLDHGTTRSFRLGCRCEPCRAAVRKQTPTLTPIDGLDQRESVGAWAKQGACRGVDPELMFPGRGDNWALQAAKALCNGDPARDMEPCPVRAECLAHALDQRELFGVWGGTSERERRRRTRRLAVVA